MQRGAKHDLEEAQAAADRLAALPTDPGLVLKEIWLLRSRRCSRRRKTMMLRIDFIAIATERWPQNLGFEGHIAMAEAML